MKKHFVAVCTTVVGLSLLGSARAETLDSKLADMLAAAADNPVATSQQQNLAAAPADKAEQQALQAESRDAVNQALENARGEQK